MKSFLASCVLLALILTTTAVNHHFLAQTTEELCACAAALPESPDADENTVRAYADELQRIWTENRTLFSLSVPASRMERVERAIGAIAVSGDEDYAAARAELMLTLRRLRETELFSLHGIL